MINYCGAIRAHLSGSHWRGLFVSMPKRHPHRDATVGLICASSRTSAPSCGLCLPWTQEQVCLVFSTEVEVTFRQCFCLVAFALHSLVTVAISIKSSYNNSVKTFSQDVFGTFWTQNLLDLFLRSIQVLPA